MTVLPLSHVTENSWQATVETMLEAYGWRFAHAAVKSGTRGWPDLFCTRGSEAIALELKTETGRAGYEQLAWIEALQSAGIDARIVRPSDTDKLAARLARQPIQESFSSNSTGTTAEIEWTQ